MTKPKRPTRAAITDGGGPAPKTMAIDVQPTVGDAPDFASAASTIADIFEPFVGTRLRGIMNPRRPDR